ncbi:MAG: hypothetical protein SGBAC_006868 [Bacillariaceae sp.]
MTTQGKVDPRHDELLTKMEETRKKWLAEEEEEGQDDTDRLLQEAISMAVSQGRGWAPGEKEEYMAKILDDDFIPPIFAESQEELEASGLAEAFSTLHYDDSPVVVALEFKKKGTDAFLDGKRNEAKNVQYFRDAVNHYYEAFAWAQKIEPLESKQADQKRKKEARKDEPMSEEASKGEPAHDDAPDYTEKELDELKSTLLSNAALAHLQLKNWGHVRDASKKALDFNKQNVKAWFRLAKAYQMLQCWEEAGDTIDSGLAVPNEAQNKDLLKLQKQLASQIRNARAARQKREKRRAERVAKVKQLWKHCKEGGYQLGRVPLVGSVSDEDEEADDVAESRWHHHHPHTGQLPAPTLSGEWGWPCLFVYPSHSQSDFVKHFAESEMLAMRMAEMFPVLDGSTENGISWDYDNEFQCDRLAVYFEINCPSEENIEKTKSGTPIVHPDSVERLADQGSTMRFYESSRALKGDEGPEMVNLVTAVERKRLHRQRKIWKKKHGSLWHLPDPLDVVRVHPAMTVKDILSDPRMVVANFLVTLVVIPENHPAHAAYLKEHKCVGVLQPDEANA